MILSFFKEGGVSIFRCTSRSFFREVLAVLVLPKNETAQAKRFFMDVFMDDLNQNTPPWKVPNMFILRPTFMDGALASDCRWLCCPAAEAFVQWLCRLHRRRVRLRWNESSPRWSLFTWGAQGRSGQVGGCTFPPMAKIRRDYLKRKLKHVGFVENLPLNRKGKESN